MRNHTPRVTLSVDNILANVARETGRSVGSVANEGSNTSRSRRASDSRPTGVHAMVQRLVDYLVGDDE